MQPSDLSALIGEVHQSHPGFRRRTVERLTERVARQFDTAAVQTFVPILVRRAVVDQLRYAEAIAVPEPESAVLPDIRRAPVTPSPVASLPTASLPTASLPVASLPVAGARRDLPSQPTRAGRSRV